jgi:hypothetical protein
MDRRNRPATQIALIALVYFGSGIAAVGGSVVAGSLPALLLGYMLTALVIRQQKIEKAGAVSTPGERARTVLLILLSLLATVFVMGFLVGSAR